MREIYFEAVPKIVVLCFIHKVIIIRSEHFIIGVFAVGFFS